MTTYARGTSPADLATAVGGSTGLADVLAPLVERDHRSGGEISYPQLSGVTPTTFGAMVVVARCSRHLMPGAAP